MDRAERAAAEPLARAWWLFLVTGILWLLIALVVLRFNLTSIAAVGVLLGVVLLMAGMNEVLMMAMPGLGWKWVHAILGVLFVIGGIWAFIHPLDAFWELAAILGFLLVLKGSFDIVAAIMTREVNDIWWLGLVVGILEILLAFWVSQQYFAPRAAIILIWVGFAALFRGVGEIVTAFELRSVKRDLAVSA
jgi:uncharacterized membrane protein HdeD (DUF308 family)